MAWGIDPITGQWSTNPSPAPGGGLTGYRPGGSLPSWFFDQMRSQFASPQDGQEYTDPVTGYNFAPKYREADGQRTFDGGTLYKIQGKGDYTTPGYVYDAQGNPTDPGFQIEHKAPGFMDNYGWMIPLAAAGGAAAIGLGGAGTGAAAGATGATAAPVLGSTGALTGTELGTLGAGVGSGAAPSLTGLGLGEAIPAGMGYGTVATGAEGAIGSGAGFVGEGVASGVPAWDAAAGGSLSNAAGFTPTAWTTGGAPVWGVVDPAVTGATLPGTSMGGALEFGASAAGGAAGASTGGGASTGAGVVPPNPYAWQTYLDPKNLGNLATSSTGKALLQAAPAVATALGSAGTGNDFEAQQQSIEARKKAARDQLNYFFGAGDGNPNADARNQLYQQVRDSAFTAGKRSLDESNADAQRKLKFELFARGLAGGSEDVDQNVRRQRTYNQGLVDLGARADSAKANFRNDDENTRLSLLQSIDAGMDQGTALSTAAQRMQLAADRAAADANGTAVGDLFSNAGLLYDQGQMARGRADAQAAFPMFSQGNKGTGGKRSGATTGVMTRLPGE